MSITGVAVEKVGFSEKSQKSGDRKCPGDLGKSFKELPDAKQLLRHRSERVFQQPQDFSTVICDGGPKLRKSRRTIPFRLFPSQPPSIHFRSRVAPKITPFVMRY